MIKDLITILPFASKPSVNNLRESLDKLSYKINVTLPGNWLHAPLSDQRCAIAVFISDAEFPKNKVCKKFDELPCISKLGIFSDTSIYQHPELIDRCNEVITWPCCIEELNYRVSRVLGNDSTSEHSKLFDPELRKEFVKMNLIGESLPFQQTLSLIKQVAKHDATVLINGETGTGKELAARAIHYMSARSSQPFIPVNCGALPEDVFENEVFGHEQGAFTDAKKRQLGLVGQAQGGTLFLDEIDSLSLKSQVALLRFLQDHQYRPLGAKKYETASVRVIAATNAKLEDLVKNGQFRSDLYFRLNILQITTPALREHLEDLPILANHLLRQISSQYGGPDKFLSADNLVSMHKYQWPGNVRELENLLHRAFLVSEGALIHLQLPLEQQMDSEQVNISGMNWNAKFNDAKSLVIDSFEKHYLSHVLAISDGNVSKAARIAGKERRSLGKLIKKHGIGNNKF